MSSTLSVSIPERYWIDIKDAPLDGSIVFVRDMNGHVDISRWSKTTNEWNAEFGVCDDLTHFAEMHIY